MTRDKKEFIEAILSWFNTPKVGNDEVLDRQFLADAYDNITQPHWISVEDELPPHNQAYLAYWLHLGVGRYRFVKANEKVGERFKEHITLWMPLPTLSCSENPNNHIKVENRVIGTPEHIKTALGVLNKKGGEE